MSVYNKENPSYLRECLNSLKCQTIKPSEVVLVEDGTISKELSKIINNFRSDLNIRSFYLPKNKNLAVALNMGLLNCSNELIARMDTDDISLPDRFFKQIKFMNENKNIAASSGTIQKFIDNGKILGLRILPLEHTKILSFAKFRCPLSHPAVMFRKSAILAVGGYPIFKHAQDYALWSLLIVRGFKLANIPDIIVKMRTGSEMLNRRGYNFLKQEIKLLRFQLSIGFLSLPNFLFNLIARTILRLSPIFIRKWFYRFVR